MRVYEVALLRFSFSFSYVLTYESVCHGSWSCVWCVPMPCLVCVVCAVPGMWWCVVVVCGLAYILSYVGVCIWVLYRGVCIGVYIWVYMYIAIYPT